MSGDDLKRIFRAAFYLLIVTFILYFGMLPGGFDGSGLQISPFLFAWTAAFIVRRPGSVGILVVVIAGIFYAIYNDEGIALGSLIFLLFSLIVHEFHGELEHQSFFMETFVMSILFFFAQLFKNMILWLFFTHSFTPLMILKYSLYFAISYVIFATLISLVFGRRAPNNVKLQ